MHVNVALFLWTRRFRDYNIAEFSMAWGMFLSRERSTENRQTFNKGQTIKPRLFSFSRVV